MDLNLFPTGREMGVDSRKGEEVRERGRDDAGGGGVVGGGGGEV